jgi:hypothetical protein
MLWLQFEGFWGDLRLTLRDIRIVLFDDFASQFRVVPSDADRRDTFFSLNEVLTRDIAFLRLGRQGLSVRILGLAFFLFMS